MKRMIRILSYFIFMTAFFFACQSRNDHSDLHDHANEMIYTCPMHPTVIREKPGSCPLCGMDLVAANRSEATKNFIMLSDAQMKLANVRTRPVTQSLFGQSATINGRLAIDQESTEILSSRNAGRIERLFIKEEGQPIQKGQPLYTLFSEQLLTLQQEYVLAKQQHKELGQSEKRYRSFLEAAEKKLLLYGLSKAHLERLTDAKSLSPNVTFFAASSGIVAEISVSEGQYISEGSELFRIENLRKLWVEAELFPDETMHMKLGDKIGVSIAGSGNDPIEATVTFLSPELRANSQIIIMRAALENSDMKYRPGQQVNIIVSHSKRQTLTVPVDAVVRSEKGAHVYLQSGKNTFIPKVVKTGLENYRDVEITQGISAGDTVAVSGAYLLYSEMILKKGKDPMSNVHLNEH
jgi:membrane fusion protein, copper/silver efflux system